MFSRIVTSVSNALELNVATLSGCTDVIVVRQDNGTLKSTPFHVRFGKTKLLRSREKEVTISVNGVCKSLRMKLNSSGEAFFETVERSDKENPLRDVPYELLLQDDCDTSFFQHHEAYQSGVLAAEDIPHSADLQLITEQKHFCLPTAEETSRVEFSLAGHLISGDIADFPTDLTLFYAHLLTWDTLNKTPCLWYHSSLICLFDGQSPFYPGRVALPLLASWVSFNRPLTSNAVKCLMETKIQAQCPLQDKSLIHWMFAHIRQDACALPSDDDKLTTWKARCHGVHHDNNGEENSNLIESAIHPVNIDNECSANNVQEDLGQDHDPLRQAVPHVQHSLRPSSRQLESLELNPGANNVTFTVTSSLQGKQMVSGYIYLWEPTCKIIVSDVDGTITRSDVLGQLMPIVGCDWSHLGVAQFFSKCAANHYQFLYLTARAIGQADATRDYLFSLQRPSGVRFTQGPLIMSPDRLFSSLKREVIDRQPYIFKIAALREVRQLFPRHYNPFYAGFGNRDTDYRAYVHIGIPETRVFTVDPAGVLHHSNSTLKTTYDSLSELSEYMFPPLPTHGEPTDDQFNDFQHWSIRDPFDYDDDTTYNSSHGAKEH